MVKYKPAILLEFNRGGLTEQFHSGFLLKMNKDNSIYKIGNDLNYPFYLRSCAKPLQASILIDLEIDKKYNLTSEEIAVCCSSHTGEDIHINTIKSLMKKFSLSEDMYKCSMHSPLSKRKQNDIIMGKEKLSVLHNNCSGKHTMMLAVCKNQGWNIENYYEISHPLQKMIKEKIYGLCEIDQEFPVSTDGCGVPIFSMPLQNMLIGYKNLFCKEKYSAIKNAFLKNSYLIGGENRLDSAIISSSDVLVAKVGAGGLCIVVNTKTEELLLVKISDCDMKARAIVAAEALKQLGWIKSESDSLKAQNTKEILTLQGLHVGCAEICFDISNH